MKAIIISLLALSQPCFANYYQRGYQICEDFAKAREWHKNEPESAAAGNAYAQCLVIKGGAGEAQGLFMLNSLVKNIGDIDSAYFLAQYIKTGGSFTNPMDDEKVDEAIQAYFEVLELINADFTYPDRYSALEWSLDLELNSYYEAAYLYMFKFALGLIGSENKLKLKSPSYEGDRDLKTYPKYSPYTLDSLNRAVERANNCLSLPLKDHFWGFKYKGYMQACQAIKDAAWALKALERDRLALLANTACSGDLPQCEEYYELTTEMGRIYSSMNKELNNIFASIAG